jgi:hypothetical protein
MNIETLSKTIYTWELENRVRIMDKDVLLITTPNKFNGEIVEMEVRVIEVKEDRIVVKKDGVYTFLKEDLLSIKKIGSDGIRWLI